MEKSHRQKRMLEKFLAYTKNWWHHFSSTVTMNTILFHSFLTHFLVMFPPNQITQNFFFLEFLTWSHIHLIKKAQFLHLESIKAAITFIFFLVHDKAWHCFLSQSSISRLEVSYYKMLLLRKCSSRPF